MRVKILFVATGNIEEIKIKSDLWYKLHSDTKNYYFIHKEYSKFLKSYSLHPTIFNLNCLRELRGVILTDSEINKLNLKGGLK